MDHLLHRTANESTYYAPPPKNSYNAPPPIAITGNRLTRGTPLPRDLLLDYVDPVLLHRLLMHLPCHTVCPYVWIAFVKTFQKCQ